MKHINGLVDLINSFCEHEAISVEGDYIIVNDGFGENGYIIECEDADDIHNTLMAISRE